MTKDSNGLLTNLLANFLYFERRQEIIEGNFTTADKKKMFLSHQFGYDSNMIRMSRSVVPVTGNSKVAPTKNEEIE